MSLNWTKSVVVFFINIVILYKLVKKKPKKIVFLSLIFHLVSKIFSIKTHTRSFTTTIIKLSRSLKMTSPFR